ncbi:MAG: hypothetical protein Q8Q09_14355 [Deltaproteobacteria bacterium]|nr:hypothetical protein [Deltaproteobacteria bacterium]
MDDERIVGLIRELRNEGIDTFVLGLTGAQLVPRLAPVYLQFLSDMAVAGGRALPGPTPYLSASNRTEVEQALARPLLEAGYCRLRRVDSRPLQSESLISESALIPRDPTHRNGWDWDDVTEQTLLLHGAACDTAIAQQIQRWGFAVQGRCAAP